MAAACCAIATGSRKPVRAARLTAVLVHGLEGSSDSQLHPGHRRAAWAAGMNVVRMNMRNCGDTDALTPTLYHSGLSADVGAVVQSLHASALGSSAWRWSATPWAATWCSSWPASGARGRRSAPSPRSARPSISPPAPTLCTSPPTASTSGHFLRGLMRRFRRKAELFPAIYQTDGIGPIRSIREFDQKIVARYCDFRDADDYYYRAASARVVDRIAVPTLILSRRTIPSFALLPKPARGSSPIPTSTLLSRQRRPLRLLEPAHCRRGSLG